MIQSFVVGEIKLYCGVMQLLFVYENLILIFEYNIIENFVLFMLVLVYSIWIVGSVQIDFFIGDIGFYIFRIDFYYKFFIEIELQVIVIFNGYRFCVLEDKFRSYG